MLLVGFSLYEDLISLQKITLPSFYALVDGIYMNMGAAQTNKPRVALWLSETSFVKLEGEQVADAVEEIDFLVAYEEDAEGLAVALLRLNEHLTTNTAGAYGLRGEVAVRAASGDGDGRGGNVGMVGIGIEHRTALGTYCGRIGGVLLVASLDDFAILQTDGCPNAEMRIGRITRIGGRLGCFNESRILGCQFLRRGYIIAEFLGLCFHGFVFKVLGTKVGKRFGFQGLVCTFLCAFG